MRNKNTIIWLIVIVIVIAVIIAILPLKFEKIEFSNSISYAGSFASFAGVVIVLFQILAVNKTSDEIKVAVEENRDMISRFSLVYDIGRHIEMISQIKTFLDASNFYLVQLRMFDIHMMANHLLDRYKELEVEYAVIHSLVKNLKEDLRNINLADGDISRLNKTEIKNHLDEIAPIFQSVSNKIKK